MAFPSAPLARGFKQLAAIESKRLQRGADRRRLVSDMPPLIRAERMKPLSWEKDSPEFAEYFDAADTRLAIS